MANWSDSYLGKLRQVVGDRLLLLFGARVIIEDNLGRVLLQKRSDFKLWGLPGGCPEVGESAEECSAREVFEETGLTVKRFAAVGFSSNPAFETVTYPNGDRVQTFILILRAVEWSGSLACLDGESLALEFFDLADLPTLMPNDRPVLEKFQEYKKSGEFLMF
ncbi:NUDIX domain-containing protein [Nostoc sp. LEGE 12447]|uniref:NUDIX hydrolase n=1 Tax=Nostoc sp. LEGE 12447 TaxID=1828640 RepID=UPI001883D3AF|nr:NUDIX domain-containing protein [Nostoc sp. LEGE 12447]MBE9000668.1 NUDIX domain-containing protein [Nostoc sp. LEGE 12447]